MLLNSHLSIRFINLERIGQELTELFNVEVGRLLVVDSVVWGNHGLFCTSIVQIGALRHVFHSRTGL
jgi:hypothetical protein